MRIIAGERKGTVLASIKGDWIRPTSDKVRGAVFSSLLSLVPDCRVFVDCFSGSGAMAIEALSRGIESVYLFEKNRKSIQIIKENLKKTKYQDLAHLHFMSIQKGLDYLNSLHIKADVFFLDPPYKKIDQVYPLLERISTLRLLSDKGIIMIEHDRNDIMTQVVNNFEIIKEKAYGNTVISIYREI